MIGQRFKEKETSVALGALEPGLNRWISSRRASPSGVWEIALGSLGLKLYHLATPLCEGPWGPSRRSHFAFPTLGEGRGFVAYPLLAQALDQ